MLIVGEGLIHWVYAKSTHERLTFFARWALIVARFYEGKMTSGFGLGVFPRGGTERIEPRFDCALRSHPLQQVLFLFKHFGHNANYHPTNSPCNSKHVIHTC